MFGKFLVHAWRQFEQKTIYVGSLRVKLTLACQRGVKMGFGPQ